MKRPIDVGVLQLSTVDQLDSHTRKLSRFHQTHRMQRVKLRLSHDFSYSIWVPTRFLQHKWIASSHVVLVYYILAVDISSFL